MQRIKSGSETFGQWLKNLPDSKTYYVLYIPVTIFIFKAFGTLFTIVKEITERNGYIILSSINLYSTGAAAGFFSSFIEWFGVLYGFLLPLILVRVWEQFDSIDREFDREADSVKILHENLNLLHEGNNELKDQMTTLLITYIHHVKENHKEEIINNDTRYQGNKILREIREKFKYLIHPSDELIKEPDSLISELIEQLDNIIDIRGDRISLSNQRLFEVLRTIGLATSIVFLLPFYYVGFTPESGLLDNVLIFGVTALVVLIYIIIDDLDEPFGGIWKIETESWDRILEDIENETKKPSTNIIN